MKFATFFLVPYGVMAIGDERGLPERYLYEKPLCSQISDCAGVRGCDAQIFTDEKGSFGLDGYLDRFSCRWEIKGSIGSRIKIMVVTGDSFGIENQPTCGFDRLHIRSADDKGYGRLCSAKKNGELPYNGMQSFETWGGEKLKSKTFHEWLLLDTNHLVVGFDSDQQKNGAGFELKYEIIGKDANAPTIAAPLDEVGDELEKGLDDLVTNHVKNEKKKTRLGARVQRLFSRFDLRMQKCRNGDQSEKIHSITLDGFNTNDLDSVEAEWLSLFSNAFNNCDLPIIRTHGSFENTNWPRRIRSVINQLRKDL